MLWRRSQPHARQCTRVGRHFCSSSGVTARLRNHMILRKNSDRFTNWHCALREPGRCSPQVDFPARPHTADAMARTLPMPWNGPLHGAILAFRLRHNPATDVIHCLSWRDDACVVHTRQGHTSFAISWPDFSRHRAALPENVFAHPGAAEEISVTVRAATADLLWVAAD